MTMTTLLQRTRRPDISFSRNGRISITARVVRLLALQPGDSVNVAFVAGECFLMAARHRGSAARHVARCYPTKRGSRNFRANSVTLCRAFLDACAVRARRAAFFVGEPVPNGGEVFLPIIYKMPIQ